MKEIDFIKRFEAISNRRLNDYEIDLISVLFQEFKDECEEYALMDFSLRPASTDDLYGFIVDYDYHSIELSPSRRNMLFQEAYEWMRKGYQIKRRGWTGFWAVKDETIMMYCKDGRVLDIREMEGVLFTFDNICANDWVVIDNADINFENFN